MDGGVRGAGAWHPARSAGAVLVANGVGADARLAALPLLVPAGLHFDRHVAQPMDPAEPALVLRWRQRVVRNKRDHGGAVAGADLPEMQVGDAVAARLQ